MYGKHSFRNSKIQEKKKNSKRKKNNVYNFNKLIYLVLTTFACKQCLIKYTTMALTKWQEKYLLEEETENFLEK